MNCNSKYELILGIGNPGKNYQNTYHNVGVLAILNITPKTQFLNPSNKEFEYLKEGGLIFVKTLTFMNESGKAVKSALAYFKVKPAKLLIIHDDSDISLGKWKLSWNKSSAGHRGIESIIDHLKTEEFSRFRIGIRPQTQTKKSAPRPKASELVLKKIKKTDLIPLRQVFEELKKLSEIVEISS